MRNIYLGIVFSFFWTGTCPAKLYFDPSMISSDGQTAVDISSFENDSQQPGNYSVEILVNNRYIKTDNVTFVSIAKTSSSHPIHPHDNTGLLPCFSAAEMAAMGIKKTAYDKSNASKKSQCIIPARDIEYAYSNFDFTAMKLNISIPQIDMINQSENWVSPQQWDEGINAALLSWQFSGNNNYGHFGNSQEKFLNLTSGINLGAWRFRDNSTWQASDSDVSHRHSWSHLRTYAERDIIPLKSDITLGSAISSNDLFKAFSFRGVQLETSENMYPDEQQGYAPVIQGVAYSNALVSVRQNGNLIYQTSVAAGPFKINDLKSVSSGGDLEVTVKEADGKEHFISVPYSSLPVLQREKHYHYSFTAGKFYNNNSQYSSPDVMQATLLVGLPHNITTYGGVQFSQRYTALELGGGINLGHLGAVSADITQANSTLSDNTRARGRSFRFQYGRALASTGTVFRLAGYRYSTRGFHTLDETALKHMSGWLDPLDRVDATGRPVQKQWRGYYDLSDSPRQQFKLNVSQAVGSYGDIFISGTRQDYWKYHSKELAWQAGFNSAFYKVNYSLQLGYSHYRGQPNGDKTLSLSLSLPLASLLPQGWGSHSGITATMNASRNGHGRSTTQTALYGYLPDQQNLNWSLAQTYDQRDNSDSNIGLGYQGTYGNISASFSRGHNYQQVQYGASGSMVLHSQGLTLGQPLGNTNVLIAAPGAKGIAVDNGTGIKTDWRGYTILPYATSYRRNRVALDISHLNNHTDITDPVSIAIPTEGAIVRAKYRTRIGARVLMKIRFAGHPVSFGAVITTAKEQGLGIVGDDGEAYIPGLPQKGKLLIHWGEGKRVQCVVDYHLPSNAPEVPLIQTSEICH